MGIATALAIASGVAGAIGSIQQGKAAQRQAEFQATVRDQQAAQDRLIAESDAEDFDRQRKAELASAVAAAGGAGIDISTGSPILAFSDFDAEAELQRLKILAGGETRALRGEQSAALDRAAGQNAKRQGFFNAGASLLDAGAFAFNNRKTG